MVDQLGCRVSFRLCCLCRRYGFGKCCCHIVFCLHDLWCRNLGISWIAILYKLQCRDILNYRWGDCIVLVHFL